MFTLIKRHQTPKQTSANSVTSRRKRLRLEALESRRLLAGDVGVEIINGNLIIDGDRFSNAIEVHQVRGSRAAFVIHGLPSEDGELTTVNGAERIAVDGVTGDVIASLRSGNDTIYIHDSDLPGNLSIRTHGGNDTVLIGGLPRSDAPTPDPVPAELTDVEPIDPQPILPVSNVTIAGTVRIATSNGQDRVGMGSVDVGRNLAIRTGRHDDLLTLGINELPGPADHDVPQIMDVEPGISLPLNVRGSLNLNTGGGADAVWFESTRVGQDMRAQLGAGDDVFSFDWGRVGGRIGILGSAGDDLIALTRLVADQIAIRTHRGADGVGLADVRADRIGVALGTGDDQMRVANTTARVARFHGGGGIDSLEWRGENHLHDLAIVNFESIS